jgi:hypothetical protein
MKSVDWTTQTQIYNHEPVYTLVVNSSFALCMLQEDQVLDLPAYRFSYQLMIMITRRPIFFVTS